MAELGVQDQSPLGAAVQTLLGVHGPKEPPRFVAVALFVSVIDESSSYVPSSAIWAEDKLLLALAIENAAAHEVSVAAGVMHVERRQEEFDDIFPSDDSSPVPIGKFVRFPPAEGYVAFLESLARRSTRHRTVQFFLDDSGSMDGLGSLEPAISEGVAIFEQTHEVGPAPVGFSNRPDERWARWLAGGINTYVDGVITP